MRVVIDTNILVGGAYDEHSVSWQIIKAVIDGKIEAYASHRTMGENRQILRKAVKDKEYKNLLEGFFRRLRMVKIFKPLKVVSDEEDNKLFESAAAARADYLITSDREVLAVEEYHGTKVATPSEFWGKYQSGRDDDSAWQDWTKMVMGQ